MVGIGRPTRRRWAVAVGTLVFSVVEAWAVIVVLVTTHPSGVTKVALACVLAGAVMAIYLATQSLRNAAPAARHRAAGPTRGWPV